MSAKVKDKATAFKHELVGSTTNKIVCKASSHEIAGPKKKHVDFLIQLTNDPHCSLPMLVDMISDRLRNSNWVVVFKALIVTHNLMTLGNEKFFQCLATRTHTFSLENFTDKTDVQAADMSTFVRKYAKYLNYMCLAYRTLAMDICRIPKGENSPFRTMEVGKLLKVTTVVLQQLDYLLEVELTSGELTNGVVNTSFLMLYKDLIKLYSVYNDALINLLEKFFEMKKVQCKEAVDVYRKFLTRQEGVHRFLQLAEDVGVDCQSHLNLRQVPEDLLPALENHISDMDSIKKATTAQPSPVIRAASEKLAALKASSPSSPSSSEKPLSTSPASSLPSANEDVLEAQRKRFEELKRQALGMGVSEDKPNSATASKLSEVIEKSPDKSTGASSAAKGQSALDDLLSLEGSLTGGHPPQANPWGSAAPQATVSNNPFQPVNSVPFGNSTSDPWTQSGSGYQEVDLFQEIRGGQPDFDSVFGSTAGQQRMPVGNSTMGEILQPTATGPLASQQQMSKPEAKGLTSDVESSLVRAAENLSVELSATRTGITKKTEHQWKPSGDPVKTGGPNWQRQQIQPKTLPPQQQQQVPRGGTAVDWSRGLYGGHFPVQPQPQPMMVQQPYMMYQQPSVQPAVWQQPPPSAQQQDPFGPIGAQPTHLF